MQNELINTLIKNTQVQVMNNLFSSWFKGFYFQRKHKHSCQSM